MPGQTPHLMPKGRVDEHASRELFSVHSYAARKPVISAAVLFLTVILVLGVYGTAATAHLNHDCFVMAEVAQSVIRGKTLYGSASWDNKPPVGLLLYSLPELLLPRSEVGMQLFLGIWLLLQVAVILYWCREKHWTATIGASAVILGMPLTNFQFTWASTEHWSNLFALTVILSAYRLWRSSSPEMAQCLWAGSAVVLAAHCRQTGVLLAVIPAMAILTARCGYLKRMTMILGMSVAAILSWGVVIALVYCVGSVPGYVDAMFIAPGRYSERSFVEIARAAYFFIATFRASLVATIGVSILTINVFRQQGPFLIVVFLATISTILAPGKPYEHYVAQMFPFLAIGVCVTIEYFSQLSPESGRRALAGLCGIVVLNGAFTAVALPWGRAALEMQSLKAAAGAIRRNSDQSDTLFCLGHGSGYLSYATDLDMAHPVFWDLFFGRLSRTIPYKLDAVIADYERNPPTIVVARKEIMSAIRDSNDAVSDQLCPTPAGELARRLLRDNDYKQVAEAEGWIVVRIIRSGQLPRGSGSR